VALDTAIRLISKVQSAEGKMQTTEFLDVCRQSLLLMGECCGGA
jgi:hypothetical protein